MNLDIDDEMERVINEIKNEIKREVREHHYSRVDRVHNGLYTYKGKVGLHREFELEIILEYDTEDELSVTNIDCNQSGTFYDLIEMPHLIG